MSRQLVQIMEEFKETEWALLEAEQKGNVTCVFYYEQRLSQLWEELDPQNLDGYCSYNPQGEHCPGAKCFWAPGKKKE